MAPAADIGVVIPAYNCEAFLPATLDSLLTQTEVTWRCVIVDDGSTDGTYAVAARYASADERIQAVKQANSGPCIARNLGFQMLGKDVRYVTFMDSDDVWMPGALKRLLSVLEQHPEAVGVHGLGEIIDEYGRPILQGMFSTLGRGRVDCAGGWPRSWSVERSTTFATVLTSSVIFPPGLILTRRSAIERAGLFDPEMRYAEDWDLLIRLTRLGDFQFINEPILWYRRHANNMGQSAAVAKQCARVQYKSFFSPLNNESQRRIARNSWRASQVLTARDRASAAMKLLRQGRLFKSTMMAGRLPIIAYRYLRGYPKPI